MSTRERTVDGGIKAADHLKRTAEAIAILGPETAGGMGVVTREEARQYLKEQHPGWAFLALVQPSGMPTPIPAETPVLIRLIDDDEPGTPDDDHEHQELSA